jgi:hypothetical protein
VKDELQALIAKLSEFPLEQIAAGRERGSAASALPVSLSHKRNSKDFDQLNRHAAVLSHDQTTKNSWANYRVGIERERFGADDDQRRRCDVSVSDLLKMV